MRRSLRLKKTRSITINANNNNNNVKRKSGQSQQAGHAGYSCGNLHESFIAVNCSVYTM